MRCRGPVTAQTAPETSGIGIEGSGTGEAAPAPASVVAEVHCPDIEVVGLDRAAVAVGGRSGT
jgi:hypothetical protein